MVASSSAIGALFAVGGYNNEVVIVADEGYLVYYSSKTMLKLRSQRVSDARIVGIATVSGNDPKEGGIQYHVHAVDTNGTYFIVDISTNFFVSSQKMNVSAKEKGAKPVLGGRAAVNTAASNSTSVISAQWCTVENTSLAADNAAAAEDGNTTIPTSLCVVLLTPSGVFTQHVMFIVKAAATALVAFTKALHFPGPLSDLVMSVGKENGLILVGQRHRTWLWVSSAVKGVVHPKSVPLRHLTLPARLMSLAITPLPSSTSFAVGGDRGEIAYYPTANIESTTTRALLANNSNIAATDLNAPLRFFSDHWHSTPLQAVAFTEDGKSVLSGAAERALMAWSVSGAFTKTKIMSSRREELTEGYLWRVHTENKIDKKNRFRPKVRKNGEAEGSSFITSDVASIIIPYTHGAVATAASPFNTNASGCYVVGVTGQVAAMDLREQKVSATADGIRWSLSADAAVGPNAFPQKAEVIDWMGRAALLIVSPADSEVRVVDPLTHQSLYTHHVRFNMETSLVNPVATANTKNSADDQTSADPFSAYFEKNRDLLERHTAKGTVGGLLATVADGGRIVFTNEDLSHLGLDSILRVWRYDPTKQRHIEVQTIHNPHTTEMLQMRALTLRAPRAKGDGTDTVTLLFTMDRLGVKCWRSVQLARHEARGATVAQRNFLHLGGIGGANGEKEADAFLWRVVGTNRCPSGRASCFEVAEDGTVILVADEVVRAYEVPLYDLSVAFNANAGRDYAAADWEELFTLRANASAVAASPASMAIDSVRFIAEDGALPAVFGRFSNGYACCWRAKGSSWGVAWESQHVHSLIKAGVTASPSEGLAVVVATAAESDASCAVPTGLTEVFLANTNHNDKKGSSTTAAAAPPTTRAVAPLPKPTGAVQYVLVPSFASSSTSAAGSASAVLADVTIVGMDAAGVRTIPVAASATKTTTVESFANVSAPSSAVGVTRLDAFFKTNEPQHGSDDTATAAEEGALNGGEEGTTTSANARTPQQLLSKVLGNEAYAAPPMSLVLSSLLSLGLTQ